MANTIEMELTDDNEVPAIRGILLANCDEVERIYQSCSGPFSKGPDPVDPFTTPILAQAWSKHLPQRLQELTPEFSRSRPRLGLITAIRTEVVLRIPDLTVIETLAIIEHLCVEPGAPQVAQSILAHNTKINRAFAFVTSNPEVGACFWLLADLLFGELYGMERSAIDYYNIEVGDRFAEIRQAKWHALFTSLILLNPSLVHRFAPRCARDPSNQIGLMEQTAEQFRTNLARIIHEEHDGPAYCHSERSRGISKVGHGYAFL